MEGTKEQIIKKGADEMERKRNGGKRLAQRDTKPRRVARSERTAPPEKHINVDEWTDEVYEVRERPLGVDEAWPVVEQPRKKKERVYNPWSWLATLLLGPLAIVLCVQTITMSSLFKALGWFFTHLGAAALNYLALLFAMTIILALIWKIWSAFLVLAIPCIVLAVINRIKLSVNGVPLLLSDFTMITEAGAVAEFMSPSFKISVGVWIGLVLTVVGVVLAGRLGWRPKELTPRWSLRRKLIGVVAALLALVMFLPYGFYKGPKGETQAERNQRLGLLGGLYSAVLNRVFDNDTYNKEQLNKLLDSMNSPIPLPSEEPEPIPTEEPEPVVPNVILMMSESFCDPQIILPGVEFDADPTPYFHALAQEWPTGKFYSNTYAGGTGNVEMEVFTGIPTAFLKEGEDLTNLRGEGVYDRLPSIVKSFKSAGYSTRFVHNYTSRLYNRTENFPAIGFDELTFEDDFPEDAKWDGPYLEDMELVYEMIRTFEEKEEGQPMLLYGLTMENHQPYYDGKFPNSSELNPRSDKLNESELKTVEALVYGVQAADKALGALVEYFETVEEPTIIVFWGDHLPGLYVDDTNTIYSKLGYVPTADTLAWDAETMKQMHTTSFLVWNNYGADLEVPGSSGPSGLGSHILDWAGISKPLYFQWVEQSMKTILLYRSRLYIDDWGRPWKEPLEEDEAVVSLYRDLVYDLVYGDGMAASALTGADNTGQNTGQ